MRAIFIDVHIIIPIYDPRRAGGLWFFSVPQGETRFRQVVGISGETVLVEGTPILVPYSVPEDRVSVDRRSGDLLITGPCPVPS